MTRAPIYFAILLVACSNPVVPEHDPLIGNENQEAAVASEFSFRFEPLDEKNAEPYRAMSPELEAIGDIAVSTQFVHLTVSSKTFDLPKYDAWLRHNQLKPFFMGEDVVRYDEDEHNIEFVYVKQARENTISIAVKNRDDILKIALGSRVWDVKDTCDLNGEVDAVCIEPDGETWIYVGREIPDTLRLATDHINQTEQPDVVLTVAEHSVEGRAIVVRDTIDHENTRVDVEELQFGNVVCLGVHDVDRVPNLRSASCVLPDSGQGGCADSVECAAEGRCVMNDHGYCGSRSAKDCKKSWRCNTDGRCGFKKWCVPTTSEHCAKSTVCTRFARCALRDGECQPSTDAHCQRSDLCKKHGRCSFAESNGDRFCEARTQTDCQASTDCTKHGACALKKSLGQSFYCGEP